MKSPYIAVVVFACVLRMASTSFIPKVEEHSNPRSIRMVRETSTDHQRYKCFEELTLKTDALLAEVRNKSLVCAEAADYQKKGHFITFQDLQAVVADKMKVTQNSLEICSKKIIAEEYFECLKSFEGETRAVLDYINLKSEQYSFELEKIEHDERYCLSKIVDENKSMSAFLDLTQCIIESPDSAETSSLPSVQPEDETNNKLEKLQNIYSTLRNCTKSDEDGSGFSKCWYQAINNSDVSEYFGQNPSEYFQKLNAIDKAENSCLRHFVAEYLSRTFISNMELENCLIYGRADSSHVEDVSEELVRQLSELNESLKNCRSGNDRAEIEDCINGLLTGDMEGITIDLKFYSILDENIQKIYDGMGQDGNCLMFVLEKLQFSGVFMNENAKQGYEACYFQ